MNQLERNIAQDHITRRPSSLYICDFMDVDIFNIIISGLLFVMDCFSVSELFQEMPTLITKFLLHYFTCTNKYLGKTLVSSLSS